MKNFIKQNWFKVVLLFLVIFLFYWYEYRPTQIREFCENYVLSSGEYATSAFERAALGGDMNKINAIEREKSKYSYSVCLHNKGLKE